MEDYYACRDGYVKALRRANPFNQAVTVQSHTILTPSPTPRPSKFGNFGRMFGFPI